MNEFIEKYLIWKRDYRALQLSSWALLAVQDRLEPRS
jgi:hypothetical protein